MKKYNKTSQNKVFDDIDKHLQSYTLHLADGHFLSLMKEYNLSGFVSIVSKHINNTQFGANIRLCLTALEGSLYSHLTYDEIRRTLLALLLYKQTPAFLLTINNKVMQLDTKNKKEALNEEERKKVNTLLRFVIKNSNVTPSDTQKLIIFEAIRLQAVLFPDENVLYMVDEFESNQLTHEKSWHIFKTKWLANNTVFIPISRWLSFKNIMLNLPVLKSVLINKINNIKV